MIARIIAILEKEGGRECRGIMSHSHRPDSQEESDGSTPTGVQHTSLIMAPKVTAQTEMFCAG